MLDLGFYLKSILATFLIIIALQTKVGNERIEQTLSRWARNSFITASLHQFAASGSEVTRRSLAWLAEQVQKSNMNSVSTESRAGHQPRSGLFQFSRSQKYQESQQDKEPSQGSSSDRLNPDED